ncbi:MAG: hypothetical protein JWL88_472 [Parcubacteria group bacterium]|nr:hypothetical protein [Parcubacteria group bacterium]
MDSSSPIAIRLQPKRYYNAIWFLVLLQLILLAIAFILPLAGVAVGDLKLWVYGLLALLITYDAVSFRSVQTDEIAGITVLERPTIETDSGVKFVPPGLTELHRIPRGLQEDQVPSDPENISKKPDNEEFDKTMYKPMRITTAGPAQGETEKDDTDMLDVRLTLEPTAAIIWQVKQKGFFEFFINIDGKTWPEKRAFLLKQMRDTVEAQLQIEFGQHTPSEIYKKTAEIAESIRVVLAEKMSIWGITICSLTLQNLEPDHATNAAMGLVPQARAKRAAAIHEAEGEKQATVMRAEGQAEAAVIAAGARVKTLAAEGEGNIAAAKALEMTGRDYIASLVAREVLGKGDVILGPEGIAQAVGLGKFIFSKPKEEA